MEWKVTGNGGWQRAQGVQAGRETQRRTPSPAEEASSAAPNKKTSDTLEVSKEALEFLQNQENTEEEDFGRAEPMTPQEKRQAQREQKMKTAAQMFQVFREQSEQIKEQSKKQADALKESLDKMKRCARIARNIGKGHKVPPKDEKYLLENDPKAYMMAMALRMLEEQKDKKRVKSELKDEEQQRENGEELAGLAEGASAVQGAASAGTEISAADIAPSGGEAAVAESAEVSVE
ncbi:hypothetical protein D7X94_02805 [Acutalibacter sp. 1XD8-33]|uniref:hypothetical protein n=1 Tax=Acutalibacter sp. 1XD8-33 TaxID=2320081 RepID=UPI000EA18349|nr:hypothetical protein [Acutalibacter sp. 1XD8-33]RKJ41761.1 hypothetical protein D7X94_02805 [Acutalibacter sp. 1XD8-33]